MLETYYKYRMEYKDFLLFIKIGNFYEVFDKDSLILNKLFGYKIKKVKDTIKVGFPLSRLDYILKLIGNINYVVIDNALIEKKEFDNNKYKDYNFDINSIILNSTLTTEGRRFFTEKKILVKPIPLNTKMVSQKRFELLTLALEGRCSIQLSY